MHLDTRLQKRADGYSAIPACAEVKGRMAVAVATAHKLLITDYWKRRGPLPDLVTSARFTAAAEQILA